MGRRVLVVDDDVLVLEVVASMLEELDCETILARSGTEALGTIANDQKIDVLIADINMPGLDGSALATRARNFRPELAVILLTGGAAASRGFPLLRKPFAQSDLRRVMAETILLNRGREVLPLMLATAHNLRNNSGSFATLAAIRRASSRVSSFAAGSGSGP